MRHRKRGRSFNRPKEARGMLIRHLSRSLLLKGRIETTVPKAKETRRMTDRLIQYGIEGNLTSYRKALQLLGNAETASFLFKEIAPLFKSRPGGGYTRLLRSRVRLGDGVELAVLELLEQRRAEVVTPKKKEERPKKETKEKVLKAPPSLPKELPSREREEAKPEEKKKKEEKRGGFLANLRKFIRPKDRS